MRAADLDLRPLVFRVIGVPAPQGSKRHLGRGRMVESSNGVRPWRDAVAWSARSAMRRAEHSGWRLEPIAMQVAFRMPRPQNVPASKIRVVFPWKRPDLDKLLRATLDGLTSSGVIDDDARIVTVMMRKRYVADDEPCGADIVLVSGERVVMFREAAG